MKLYTSGRPRVHASFTREELDAAITEYEAFAQNNPADPLARELSDCAKDLREEIAYFRPRKLAEVKERKSC